LDEEGDGRILGDVRPGLDGYSNDRLAEPPVITLHDWPRPGKSGRARVLSAEPGRPGGVAF
jgi:hypothetical protein